MKNKPDPVYKLDFQVTKDGDSYHVYSKSMHHSAWTTDPAKLINEITKDWFELIDIGSDCEHNINKKVDCTKFNEKDIVNLKQILQHKN
jgi:hypothetical protein